MCTTQKSIRAHWSSQLRNPLFQLVLPRVIFYLFDRAWIVFVPPIVFWISRAHRDTRYFARSSVALHGVLANQGDTMRFFENRAPTNEAVAAPGGPLFAIEGHLSFDTGLAVSDTPH